MQAGAQGKRSVFSDLIIRNRSSGKYLSGNALSGYRDDPEAARILVKQQMYCFHNISNPVRVDGIMDEFAIPFGLDDSCPSQDGQVLGSYGLLQSQLDIEFCDCQLFMLVQDTHNLLPELVIQGPEDHGGLFQIHKIHFNCSIFTRLGIEDHPIITACTTHTVRLVVGLIKDHL